MTPTAPNDHPAPPTERPDPCPYAAPALTPLGAIGSLTAGPDQSPDKVLDQLFGGTGGFARDNDGTS